MKVVSILMGKCKTVIFVIVVLLLRVSFEKGQDSGTRGMLDLNGALASRKGKKPGQQGIPIASRLAKARPIPAWSMASRYTIQQWRAAEMDQSVTFMTTTASCTTQLTCVATKSRTFTHHSAAALILTAVCPMALMLFHTKSTSTSDEYLSKIRNC